MIQSPSRIWASKRFAESGAKKLEELHLAARLQERFAHRTGTFPRGWQVWLLYLRISMNFYRVSRRSDSRTEDLKVPTISFSFIHVSRER